MRCVIVGCDSDNQSKQNPCKDVRFFSFSKDPNLSKKWLHLSKRKDKVKIKNALVCSKHFCESDYKVNLKHTLLGYTPKNYRGLKYHAIPTQNLPQSVSLPGPSISGAGKKRKLAYKKRQRAELIQVMMTKDTWQNMNYFIEENVIKTPNLNFNNNLGGVGTMLFEYMKTFSSQIAQIQTETGDHDTYESLLEKCIKTSVYMKNIGIKKGDLVCLCSDMILNSCIPLISAYFIGAVTYCLEPTLPVSESAELVKLLPPKIIFVSENAVAVIDKVLQQANVSSKTITLGNMFEKCCLSDELDIEGYKPEYIADPSEVHCIYFSSGSTGAPKAILLNHQYTFTTAHAISGTWGRNGLHLGEIQNPIVICHSNWHWISSLSVLILSITSGATRILSRNFDGKKAWYELTKYKITNMFLSPYQCIEFYFNRPENPSKYLSAVRELVTGGSSLSEEYMVLFNKLLQPSALIRAEYGLTEVGYVTNFDPTNKSHQKYIIDCPNSVGCPVDGIWYKVVDLDSGKCLGPNQPGELRLKISDQKAYFNGYYNLDSSECFDKDGWFKTEDIAYFDKNMCFYIVDRLKARLIYKDWLIYPSVIEKVLLQHPLVKNAVVIGIPHKEDGENLMGVVMLNDQMENKTACKGIANKENFMKIEEELVLFVEDRVEDYQRLRKGVKIVPRFPLTVSGKISRLKIKQMIIENTNFLTCC